MKIPVKENERSLHKNDKNKGDKMVMNKCRNKYFLNIYRDEKLLHEKQKKKYEKMR